MTPREEKMMIIQGLRDELERIQNLSPEEAQEDARQNLQAIGVLDQDGNVIQHYQGVFVHA